MKKVLLVSPHPDDVECGCGGTIAKHHEDYKFYSVMFAPCTEDPLNKGILNEFNASMKVLKIKQVGRHDFPRNTLEFDVQKVRDILHSIRVEWKPDVVFCPSLYDLHQDHRVVAEACLTIFRDSATLLAYEIVRSTIDFKPTLFIQLSEKDIATKLEALLCYKTQQRRTYFKPNVFRALATFRGSQINSEYAEAFEVLRMINL